MNLAQHLLRQLNETDEHTRIEAKSTRNGLGNSALTTISAFCNEPGLDGGFLLLGVAPAKQSLFPIYEPIDGLESEKIQEELATNCATAFNIAVRPKIAVEAVHNKKVIVAFIPEVSPNEKPVFIKKLGLPQGAFRRIGPTDQHCTDEDLALIYQDRRSETYDQQPVDALATEVNAEAVERYRIALRASEPDAECLREDDTGLLLAVGAARRAKGNCVLTLAGLLVFGKESAIRRCMPLVRIDYITTESTEWMRDAGVRTKSTTFQGRLPDVITRTHARVLADLPKSFALPPGAVEREDIPAIPSRVIREAIVNSVMHRDYRIPGSVQVIRYPNRLELRNPGYSLKSEDLFGQPGSLARNQLLASLLHDLRLAETRGMGIGIMQRMMAEQSLFTPYLESDRAGNAFSAFLIFHEYSREGDREWIARFGISDLSDGDERALVFVREMGAINNTAYRALSGKDSAEASKSLRRLREYGLLIKRDSGHKTWYTPTAAFSHPEKREELSKSNKSEKKTDKSPSEELVTFDDLPIELQEIVHAAPRNIRLGGKSKGKKQLWCSILELCKWRELKSKEIAGLLQRQASPLRNTHISQMLEDDLLTVTESEKNSPLIRYRTTSKGEQWLVQHYANTK